MAHLGAVQLIPQASKPADDSLSLWSAVSPARLADNTLEGDISTDVAIVGGGFVGLSAALHLAKSGSKVCLVEGRTIGWGGSGRNNGQVIPVLSGSEPDGLEARYGEAGERLVELVRDSADLLFNLAQAESINCEAEQSGWFQPAHSPDHVRLSEMRVNAWMRRGAPCRLLDGDETELLLGSKNWYGGMLNPTGGHVNPLMLARGLAAACEQAGVEIFEKTPVTSIDGKGQQWEVVSNNGSIKCDAVLMATNAYSNELSDTIEIKVARSVIPVTSWQMSTTPVSEELQSEIIPGRQAVSDTRGDLQFFRYDARNQLIAGAAMMFPHNAAERLDKLVGGRLATAFPQLGKPEFTHIWSGYVGITLDHFPHFHQVGPDYYTAIGFNGRGVALSISIGREIAKAINGIDVRELALPLSPIKPVPFFSVARCMSRGALAWYRWRDKQNPKV